MKTYRSFSSAETKKLGRVLAQKILKRGPNKKGATVLALTGNLGGGKTTFVQGFFRGLRLKEKAVSPTFIIMRRSTIRSGVGFKNIFHVDAYRLNGAADLEALGFRNIFSNPKNIILVEWAKKVKQILPKNSIWLRFRHGAKENERRINLPDLSVSKSRRKTN